MTSLATIFGAMPIALGLGAGAESRMPLGIVVVGGLFFALVLTLFVIPVMYVLLGKNRRPAPQVAVAESPLTPLIQKQS
jgi:multidrug efflux pump subunit AcrB